MAFDIDNDIEDILYSDKVVDITDDLLEIVKVRTEDHH